MSWIPLLCAVVPVALPPHRVDDEFVSTASVRRDDSVASPAAASRSRTTAGDLNGFRSVLLASSSRRLLAAGVYIVR